MAVLGPVITVELGLSNSQFAGLTTVFLIAYTVSQGLSGKLYDRIGAKRGFALSIVVWSLASMAHAFARSFGGLLALRFALGIGEAGNWPGAAKIIGEWFPERERALAMGIFNSGTSIASVVAPPLIIWIQLHYGWRAAFLILGAVGFVWLALWLCFYVPPARPLSGGERVGGGARTVPWSELLRHREAWAIVLARFFADPVWWLYITWLPLYLYNVRHFSIRQIGAFAWLPFVAADAGALSGGWLSGHLIARGWSVDRARKTVMIGGMCCMCTGVFAAGVESAMTALALIAVVLFGFQFWINNVQTLPIDYFPQHAVGSVTGLGGAGAGIGSILLIQTTGLVVDRTHSYTPILVGAGLLPIVATAVLFRLGGKIRRLSLDDKIQS